MSIVDYALPIFVVALLALALYRRASSTLGQQPVRAGGVLVRAAILVTLCAMLLGGSSFTIGGVAAGVGGAIVGAGLAVVALQRTTFETTAAGRFYTPDPYLGMFVLALFMARLGWRLATVTTTQGGFASYGTSPASMGTLFLWMTYNIAYGAGVVVRSRITG